MDNTVELTAYHYKMAAQYGRSVASTHKHVLGLDGPRTEEELLAEHTEADVIFAVTGEKAHDVPDGYLLIEEFEGAYYYDEVWEAEDE